jgi:hypothetical protein
MFVETDSGESPLYTNRSDALLGILTIFIIPYAKTNSNAENAYFMEKIKFFLLFAQKQQIGL